MQKITPHLWFDTEAEAAAEFYVSLFKNSQIGAKSHYGKEGFEIHHMPEGTLMTIEFTLAGQKLMALNGGPVFKFTPAISFIINCETKDEVDELWNKLSEGGTALMPLDVYPFSDWYGWIQDQFGLSWQLILSKPEGEMRPKIIPSLLFVGDICGKAEEAIGHYTSLFNNSKTGLKAKYGPDQAPDKEGTLMFGDFMLEGQWFAAMDSAHEHKFTFTEAISFMVHCETQEEVDHLWTNLSAVPESEQCGWLKDKYGVSWQIVPTILGTLMSDPDPEKSGKVMTAMLSMKKLDIEALKNAYES